MAGGNRLETSMNESLREKAIEAYNKAIENELKYLEAKNEEERKRLDQELTKTMNQAMQYGLIASISLN